MAGYLRIDGEEHGLHDARLTWQPATSGSRTGILFHVHASGARTLLHLAGWAPGDRVTDLSGQVLAFKEPGPDAAVDGRFLENVVVRFGRVRDDRAVLSVDAEAEDIDPDSRVRATLESDVRSGVERAARRNHCLGCGRTVDDWAVAHDEFIGGVRVTVKVCPVLCPDCAGKVDRPRHCPTCGHRYDDERVHTSADAGGVGWTATCPEGHTFSGALPTGS